MTEHALWMTIRKVKEDIAIYEFMIRMKQFNIDNAEILKRKLIRENELEILRMQDEIASAQERIKAYEDAMKQPEGEHNAEKRNNPELSSGNKA